jgi:hypothetical protein
MVQDKPTDHAPTHLDSLLVGVSPQPGERDRLAPHLADAHRIAQHHREGPQAGLGRVLTDAASKLNAAGDVVIPSLNGQRRDGGASLQRVVRVYQEL